MNPLNEPLQEAYQLIDRLNFDECKGCSECCKTPWLLSEEIEKLNPKEKQNLYSINETSFIKSNPKCAFEKNGSCMIYNHRPLDCRLFPMDLIEIDGEFWWCVFKSCKKHHTLAKKIQLIIPELEKLFTTQMLIQYSRQCKTTNFTYEPQQKQNFIKLQRLKVPVLK